MSGPHWTRNDDRTVTVRFPTTPPIELILTTEQVEQMLQSLGEFRQLMTPEPPRDFKMGQTFAAVPDPIWVTETERMQGNSVLHIRDPRFGWLHYMILRHDAEKLGYLLQRQATSPEDTPPAKKN